MRTTVPANIRKGSIAELEYLLHKSDERRIPGSFLPEGWTEAKPGGLATNPDRELGGIIDIEIGGDWFVIFHREGMPILDGFATRDEAFNAFAVAMAAPVAT